MRGFILLLVALLTLSQTANVVRAEDDSNAKHSNTGAMMRLLTASLSAPNADATSILNDAKQLFGEDALETVELEELVEKVTSTSAAAAPSCKNTEQLADDADSDAAIDVDDDNIPSTGDRVAKRVATVRNDYDCMEREFDMSSKDFNAREAAAVLNKCRLLVVRNIWPASVIEDYKINFSNYISDLHEGRISNEGSTTLGEAGFWARRSDKRFDIILPEYLKKEAIFANPKVKKIMSSPQALGKDFIINSIGAVIAESGAPMGKYHYDDAYLMGDDSFGDFHLAGADLPPWAVTMFFPVMNVTMDHGPTEFCMGTNHFKGLDNNDLPHMKNETLVGPDTDFATLHEFETEKDLCPEEFTRIPLLNMGDAIFFDYTITHRGGENQSPDLRAMQYVFYSRYWYRDSNFEEESLPGKWKKMTKNEIRTQTTRFALPNGNPENPCDTPPCTERVPLESITNFMDPAEQMTEFVVKNVDLEGASLYVGSNGSKHLVDVGVGESIVLTLKVGSKLGLTRVDDDAEDDWISTWQVRSEQADIQLETEILFAEES